MRHYPYFTNQAGYIYEIFACSALRSTPILAYYFLSSKRSPMHLETVYRLAFKAVVIV
jgi:hypothetical protein